MVNVSVTKYGFPRLPHTPDTVPATQVVSAKATEAQAANMSRVVPIQLSRDKVAVKQIRQPMVKPLVLNQKTPEKTRQEGEDFK